MLSEKNFFWKKQLEALREALRRRQREEVCVTTCGAWIFMICLSWLHYCPIKGVRGWADLLRQAENRDDWAASGRFDHNCLSQMVAVCHPCSGWQRGQKVEVRPAALTAASGVAQAAHGCPCLPYTAKLFWNAPASPLALT